MEEKILKKRKSESDLDPYLKPFQAKLEQLTEDTTIRTEYPSKDERFGSVTMGWRLKGQLYEAMPSIQVRVYLKTAGSSTILLDVKSLNYHLLVLGFKYLGWIPFILSYKSPSNPLRRTFRTFGYRC